MASIHEDLQEDNQMNVEGITENLEQTRVETQEVRKSSRQNIGKTPEWLNEYVGVSKRNVNTTAANMEDSNEEKDVEQGSRIPQVATSVNGSQRSRASSKASTQARLRREAEQKINQELYELEVQQVQKQQELKLNELKKKMLLRKNELRLAEIEELSENSQEEEMMSNDFRSAKNTFNDEAMGRTFDWIASQDLQRQQEEEKNKIQETKHITVSNEDKIGEAILMMAKLQTDNNKEDIKMFMKRQIALTPLREFSGRADEWPGFMQDFKSSTEMCNLTNEENLKRLCKCLRGRAKDLFLAKLKNADQVPKVMRQMEEMFGSPRLIIQTLIKNIKEMPQVKGDKPETLINLAHVVDSLVDTMEVLNSTGHIENPQLMDDIVGKLPVALKIKWAESIVESKTNVTLVQLAEWLCKRAKAVNILRNIESDNQENGDKRRVNQLGGNIPTAAGLVNSNSKKNSCIFCEKEHESWKCYSAPKMTIDERKSCVMKSKVCFVCLVFGHRAKDCRSSVSCTTCNKKHHAVMCFLDKNKVSNDEKKNLVPIKDNALGNCSSTPEVLLQTLVVTLRGTDDDMERTFRALVDSGSQRSYITKKAAAVMRYVAIGKENISHGLFGGSEILAQEHLKYQIRISAIHSHNVYTFATLDQEKICSNISKVPVGPWIKELQKMNIHLTDVGNGVSEIDLLIGADVIGKLYTGDVRILKTGPVAVGTHLGWTLLGKLPKIQKRNSTNLFVTTLICQDQELQHLWKLETLGITDPAEVKSKQEIQKEAVEHFEKTVTINNEGRYEVSLPWITGHRDLPTNRKLAEKRLINATKKIVLQGILQEYSQIFIEWKEEGIIEEVPKEEYENYGHYLSHHAVRKLSSETTKTRPVFHANAHEENSPSLNDCLQKGENLLELIPDVLTRFRIHKIGITADIKKAFLQISIKPEDRDYCRFLWWEQPDSFQGEMDRSNLKIYRHCRVPFGLKPSPFLLGATINHHLDSVPKELKTTAQVLKKSYYVDNCVVSVPSEEKCNTFIIDCKKIMNAGKFDLRCWVWNSEESTDDHVPVLGLIWNVKEDTLRCEINITNNENLTAVTKRNILSVAHSIFDPIGFTCPALLLPKLLLQESWKLKTKWDEPLPSETRRQFLEWRSSLLKLKEIKIPRWFFKAECPRERWTLHVFTDASVKAYAACVFLRAEIENKVYVQLVAAKTRVKPVKDIFIPRMELLGCLIGSRLAEAVKRSLEYPNIPTIYWTDSSNALYWIRNESEWNVFVMNRVREIRLSSGQANWRHVPGTMNPADLPSRGCSVKNLLESSWWEGPQWLRQTEDCWPKSKIQFDEDVVNSERKKTNLNLSAIDVKEKFSDTIVNTKYENTYEKCLRIVSWIHRFINNCRLRITKRQTGMITAEEIERAEITIVKIIQAETIVQDSTLLKGIRTFKDENDIVRVKTKISRRDDIHSFKYPAVLPSNHEIVKLLITSEHIRLSHAGVQVMMCTLRERFWIIHSRKTVRQLIRKCIRCRRLNAKNVQTEPSPLPLNRVRDANIFEIVGVDLAGPLFLKNKKKVWICLFTCAIYRAIHLELVSSLSTDSFLQALRRFISRRGRPSCIYSDNGTNFVGAHNALENLDWEKIQNYPNVQRIKWIFNPPSAAWWGGFWERMVRMVKESLKKVLGKASLNFEDLETFLCETENLINSRPLTYLSEDCEDLSPLTPAMFLNEIPQFGSPDLDVLDGESYNKRLVYRHKVREDLRQRFRSEYLALLIQPAGKLKQVRSVKPGDIVLVGNDCDKRINWTLARVTEVIPGKDGVTRVVRLRTPNGEIVRPIQRIYPLEVSSEDGKDLITNMEKSYITTRSGRKIYSS